MSNSKIMKIITGSLEAFLAIPIIGGVLVFSTFYIPLVVLLILHIVTFIISSKERTSKIGSTFGIVTSLLAWIPLLGWMLHLITALILIVDSIRKEKRSYGH